MNDKANNTESYNFTCLSTEKPIEIVRKIEYTKATEKGEATFECETSKEAAAVKWLKGMKPISGSDK